MTRDEVKALLQELGIKAEQITDQVIEKLEQKIEYEKSQLDTKTRRTMRKFWSVIAVCALAAGVAIGYFFF